ncbi:hypothetical protein RIR_jg2783.t1 [Rhizophagus irregularis DAOM 181602=DAOM 197198]|nr:hypothetical protein RIR_jg2783.t1 [Rhizophagus irregularis DAOM 181602=DAOM 197198]
MHNHFGQKSKFDLRFSILQNKKFRVYLSSQSKNPDYDPDIPDMLIKLIWARKYLKRLRKKKKKILSPFPQIGSSDPLGLAKKEKVVQKRKYCKEKEFLF